ncbi:MAG: exodeoxyribonuclease VII large subunit [Nitrospiraceae bacterium]|nr:exodeoxyribonuclease VII large subunit [Nitrospiraceae bacterium]
MAEPLLQRNTITLSELNASIKAALSYSFPDAYWVIAEIAESRCDQKGHCYFNLIEKDNDRTVAQIRANCWSYEYRKISQKFEKATGEHLRSGMKVLFLVAINFHEVYGLSLLIRDIDPSYSLGEMARKKREVIERLQKEGLIELNKGRRLPMVPQRIAVVSAPGAAGYGDFMSHLANNPFGYRFNIQMFPAIMQGQEAEKSIVAALCEIQKRMDAFDVVALVRGGGSQVELNCYDGYELAAAIAKLPLPVFTGIGHERDDTVADMVAHTRMKTPTAVADFLISGLKAFEDRVLESQRRLGRLCEKAFKDENHNLSSLMQRFRYAVKNTLKRSDPGIFAQRLSIAVPSFLRGQKAKLDSAQKDMKIHALHLLQAEDNKLTVFEKTVRHLDPVNVLKRGYSVTSLDGRVLKSVADVEAGVSISIRLQDGTIKGKVQEVTHGE